MAFTLCLNTSTIMPQPILEKIRLTAEAGYAGIELWVNDVYAFIGRGGEVRDIEKALADHGLIVPCMIATRGWAEASEFEYPHQLQETKRRLELAARLGSPYLVCSPPYEPFDLSVVASRYRELLELGRNIGCRPTYEYISFFRGCPRLDQAWQVVQEANDPDATLVMDAFHTWNSGGTLDDIREVSADRIAHYHIDDAAQEIPAGQQLDPDRVMVGDGVIDLKAEIQTLRDIGYDKTISLELFNKRLWEQDPGEVLRIGMERLQALLEE